MSKRRIAQFLVSHEVFRFNGFESLAFGRVAIITSDLPNDTRVFDVFREEAGPVCVIVESESFGEVDAGAVPPQIQPMLRREELSLDELVARIVPEDIATRSWAVNRCTIEKIRQLVPGAPTLDQDLVDAVAALANRLAEADEKLASINSPELLDFDKGTVLEAQHQRLRWPSEQAAGKEPSDWFWLIGYLAGKALTAHLSGNTEKALHHTISSAAALRNWHAAIKGSPAMRPGIETPAEAEENA